MAIATVNPTTGQLIKSFEALSDAQLEVRLQKAVDAFSSYRNVPFAARAQMMLKAAAILDAEKETFARIMTTEMGKTFRSAVDEAAKCAWVCKFYAENAERFLADEVVETSANRSYIRYQPLGPVLAVMPWNFPFWQVFRFAAPTRIDCSAMRVDDRRHLSQSGIPGRCLPNTFDRFAQGGPSAW